MSFLGQWKAFSEKLFKQGPFYIASSVFSNVYLPKSISSTKSPLKSISFTGYNTELGNQYELSDLCYPLQLSLSWVTMLQWFKMLNQRRILCSSRHWFFHLFFVSVFFRPKSNYAIVYFDLRSHIKNQLFL